MLQAFFFAVLFLAALLAAFFVHEAGHLLAARLTGIHARSVTFGTGREVWRRTDRHGTRWAIRIYPFSAHVSLSDPDAHVRDGFDRAPIWRKACTVLAGPLANFGFAVTVFTVFYYLIGVPSTPPVIAAVERGGPAAIAGFRQGDTILAIDGRLFERYEDVQAFMDRRFDRPVPMIVARDTRIYSAYVQPQWTEYRDINGFSRQRSRLGTLAMSTPLKLTAVSTVNGEPVKDIADAKAKLLPRLGVPVTLGLLSSDGKAHVYDLVLDQRLNKNLAAPETDDIVLGNRKGSVALQRSFAQSALVALGTVGKLTGGTLNLFIHPWPVDFDSITLDVLVPGSAAQTVHIFLYVAALLSIWIGLLNCLPIPGLDGYMLLRLAVEKITGHERAHTVHRYVWRAWLVMIAAFMVLMNMTSPG